MGEYQTITLWAQAMRAAGRSERTVTERLRLLRATGLDLDRCGTVDIECWLAGQPHLTASSRRSYVDVLRAFFKFALARGLRPDDPTAGLMTIKAPRHRPKPITAEQFALLLGRAGRRRTRGYLLLGGLAGLRVSEIARVRGDDVDLSAGTLTVLGKGGHEAVLPLHPLLAVYATQMPIDDWWFPAYDRPGPVSGNNISKVLADHMTRCGVPGTAHCLRHFFATALVASGTQTRVVQELLRHANLQTTQVYADVTPAQMAAAVKTVAA